MMKRAALICFFCASVLSSRVVLLSSNGRWGSSISLTPVPSSLVLFPCLAVPLFPYITQELCHGRWTRLVVLRNQLQHSLLKGFVGNWCYQNTVRVVGWFSNTFAFFLPLLRSLLYLAKPKPVRNAWYSISLFVAGNYNLIAYFRISPSGYVRTTLAPIAFLVANPSVWTIHVFFGGSSSSWRVGELYDENG